MLPESLMRILNQFADIDEEAIKNIEQWVAKLMKQNPNMSQDDVIEQVLLVGAQQGRIPREVVANFKEMRKSQGPSQSDVMNAGSTGNADADAFLRRAARIK